jgi:hypothetical protein
LVVGIELHVFDEGMLPVCFLRPEWLCILGGGVKWDQFVLILHSRNYLLPHLWFLARVMFPIRWIDIVIGSVVLCF